LNLITIKNRKQKRTAFENENIKIDKELERIKLNESKYNNKPIKTQSYKSVENVDEANEIWNKIPLRIKDRKTIKFHETTKNYESKIAYRKNWAENLYEKHLKQGRLEKYRNAGPESQSDDGSARENKITNRIITLDQSGKYRDSENETIGNRTRKESIRPETDKYTINKRKIENVNTIRHEELLEDLEQSFLEDQTKIVREPLTPTIKLEFKNCIVEALIDTGAEI
jgi:hypothetical protein